MALPTLVKNPDQVKTGPGLILTADLGSPVPTPTVSGSKFTMSFDASWDTMGYTDEGLQLVFGGSSEPVEVAEERNPIRQVQTTNEDHAQFALAGINANSFLRAFRGGTFTRSGSGSSQISKYSPPVAGTTDTRERCMLAWLSDEQDELFIAYEVFQRGEIGWQRRKGAQKASLSGFDYLICVPDDSVSDTPWNWWYAGTWADALS